MATFLVCDFLSATETLSCHQKFLGGHAPRPPPPPQVADQRPMHYSRQSLWDGRTSLEKLPPALTGQSVPQSSRFARAGAWERGYVNGTRYIFVNTSSARRVRPHEDQEVAHMLASALSVSSLYLSTVAVSFDLGSLQYEFYKSSTRLRYKSATRLRSANPVISDG